MAFLKIYITLFCALYLAPVAYSQQCAPCKETFDQLILLEQKKAVSDAELLTAWQYTKDLRANNYSDYIDSVVGNTMYSHVTLTETVTNIARKRCDEKGVSFYLDYLALTSGSAEEERAFGLERIFKSYPSMVLTLIDTDYLDDIAWGFVSNRSYGPNDPFDDFEMKMQTDLGGDYFTTLTAENYKEIFYDTYPSLSVGTEYKSEVERLLKQIDFLLNYE